MATDFVEIVDLGEDFSQLQTWDGVQSGIDPGDYAFEVVGVKQETSSGGKPMMIFVLRVISDGSMKGREVWHRCWYTTDGGRKRLKNLFEAVGLQVERSFQPASLLGCQFIATATKREYDDVDANGQAVKKTATDINQERALEGAQKAAPAPAPNPVVTTTRGRVAAPNGPRVSR